MTQAKSGDSVKIHYTGRLTDGTVFDSSDGREPLGFTIGNGEVIPGFEEAVSGMAVGESKNVTIPMDKAYGPRLDQLIIDVPRSQVPPDLNPELDQRLQMSGPNGENVVVKVVDVSDDSIKLDANPPLAGEDLNFDIELVEIA
ncbi:FKBP-type peptidyl-prolyl cis-trans isomerase [Desulfurivibrio alkaliphilus]|uniref:Peptidyl-prolyl cis-trans isomerase n=1 Tax=Desulfurivibrio alkaliphilus (strain DSM 19089 / UNIQEM U267 / AHT2) TaxID=589865 RepID=D6Z6I8_DESAT|nr:FKBP-type peptidyl-prolyl cis-trans isomerase [Desulfurivibrio alkaliphilus]ADH84947.1 peptidylprolyl isomerase FKBP-type [Desulfurivibrio alkaliphilus AHT 2]